MRVLGEQATTLTSVESAYVRSISAPTAISAMVRTRYTITYEQTAAFGALQPMANDAAYGEDAPQGSFLSAIEAVCCRIDSCRRIVAASWPKRAKSRPLIAPPSNRRDL